ncbi:MAG TPA: outer membrane beta-barrel protein [Hyphomicrobiaceae bacterium]|nr:outer membrane beta-barrel protein [Hyphomicrobiaceae bacterium]
MKKLLPAIVAMVAAALFAGGAHANGTGSIKDAPLIMPTGWSGFYFGAGVGYGDVVIDNNYFDTSGAGTFLSERDEGGRGGLGTVILGFDRQIGERWVIGAFVDFDWTDIDLHSRVNNDPEDTLSLEWMWAVGGRVGYLFNPSTLIYFAGGFTQAHFDNDGYYEIVDPGPPVTSFPGKSSVTHNGFFVAFGLETMLTSNLFLRGEMRYSEYDGEIINSGVLASSDTFTDEQEPTVWTGRFTLTYKIPHGHRTYEDPMK